MLPSRPCGSSRLRLPVLGVGCWSFGGGGYWGPQDQREVDAVVRCAFEHGCNYFDTAEAYNGGASESSLGIALAGLPRDEVIIGSKISPSHTAPALLAAHCDASLRRLRVDHLDLYMVHWPITAAGIRHFTPADIPVPAAAEAFAALGRLQQAGKIRQIGVSNFGPARLAEALAAGIRVAANELPYNLLARAIEAEILPECRRRGVGAIGYMSLLQGALGDRHARLDDLPPMRRRTRHFDSRRNLLCRHGGAGAEEETEAALQGIRAVAKREGMTTPALALRWALASEEIACCLCGARDAAQMRANLDAVRRPLDPAAVAELNALTQPLKEKLGPSFDYYEAEAGDRSR